MTGYGKRVHFTQELIFQNKQLKFAIPLVSKFVHVFDSLKCYTSVRKVRFYALKCI